MVYVPPGYNPYQMGGIGAPSTGNSQADIMAQYNKLLALLNNPVQPVTNTDQYTQMMQMYGNQMGAMNDAYSQQMSALGKLGSMYDPNLGKAQMEQMQHQAGWQQQLARKQERLSMVPGPHNTMTNMYGY